MTVRNLFSAWVATAMLAAFASSAAEHRLVGNDQLYGQVNATLQMPEHNAASVKESDHE
jgi:hypothetical protein